VIIARAAVIVYLVVTLAIGLWAGLRGRGDVEDFVAGERSFGPVLMYFVVGATIFSAYALLGTPQRVITHGTDVLYILAYGSVGYVPLFFLGPRVRRIGAREGYVTQAELVGGRFRSAFLSATMGIATVVAFVPYLVIQLKGAAIVMEAVFGVSALVGAGIVYSTVLAYVLLGGVRGVGFTNVVQGVAMIVVVWGLGLFIPLRLYGGIGPMFDRVAAEFPQWLTLPGPGERTSEFQYSAEVLVSILGFSMWPHAFMKAFSARSARLVQLTVVLYPTFLFFILPLVFLGYAALLAGGPSDDTVLLWLAARPELGDHGIAFAFLAFAVLAASMSTGDALLHAGGSIAVRDVLVRGFGLPLDDRSQTQMMRIIIVVLALVAFVMLEVSIGVTVVDLLLLAYAVPIQFLPLVVLGLSWRRANRVGAEWGLAAGLGVVSFLFVCRLAFPGLYQLCNPLDLQIGVVGMAMNLVVLVVLSLAGRGEPDEHLRRFEL
jgi:SSS family solute:Na+ symporter